MSAPPNFTAAPVDERTAIGANVEGAVGLTDHVELGVRTGVRPGDPEARAVRADEYGRLFDRQLFDLSDEFGLTGTALTGTDTLANPEVRVRAALVEGRVGELGLEGRLLLPFEAGTNAGLMFGVPLAFHFGARVRIDTGVYVPVVFVRPTALTAMSVPLDVWIQVSRRVWLGPLTGYVAQRPWTGAAQGDFSLGFGFGYAVTHYLDVKAMALFPKLDHEGNRFGVGVGVELRIE